MLVQIDKSIISGEVVAPPSKSLAHRLLIAAALADGCSTINNIAYSQDILATIDCLRAFGSKIETFDSSVTVYPADFACEQIDLSARESGSTLRFMIPLALRLNKEVRFTGSKRLMQRPLSVYEDLCKENGWLFELKDDVLTVKGQLKAGHYKVRGDISSQFISGLMFALSLEDEESSIEVTQGFESRSYVGLTVDALNMFKGRTKLKKNIVTIKPARLEACNCCVEGDQSNSAFLECFNYLNGHVRVKGLNPDSHQGDSIYHEYFFRLDHGYEEFDLADCPDLGPVMIALAALKSGAHFINTKRLASKECDRGLAMKEELAKIGAEVIVNENDIIVNSKPLHSPSEIINGHNDHRIVMAMSMVLTVLSGKINDCEAVNKSFPDYFEKLIQLNGKVTQL